MRGRRCRRVVRVKVTDGYVKQRILFLYAGKRWKSAATVRETDCGTRS